MKLQYHQKTFDLIGVTPRVSAQALFWLDRVEQEQRIRLPGALRELYAVVCQRELLTGAMLRVEQRRTHLLEFPLEVLLTGRLPAYLPLAYNGQSTLEYTVQPNTTAADPPVYSNYRSAYAETRAVRESYREVHTDTLSAFLYWLVWDRLDAPYGGWFAHSSNILKVAVVRALERYFTPITATRTTTEVTYRFEAEDATLTLAAEVYNGFEMNPFLHVRAQVAATFREVLGRLRAAGHFGAISQPDNLRSAQVMERLNP